MYIHTDITIVVSSQDRITLCQHSKATVETFYEACCIISEHFSSQSFRSTSTIPEFNALADSII